MQDFEDQSNYRARFPLQEHKLTSSLNTAGFLDRRLPYTYPSLKTTRAAIYPVQTPPQRRPKWLGDGSGGMLMYGRQSSLGELKWSHKWDDLRGLPLGVSGGRGANSQFQGQLVEYVQVVDSICEVIL